MRKLRITVAGEIGTGKSCIAHDIKKFLQGRGFEVTNITEPKDCTEEQLNELCSLNRDVLPSRVKVEILEIQTAKQLQE